VGDVVAKFIEQWGSGKWMDISAPDSLHEDFTLRLCCDKAHTYLKWHTTLNIEQCLNMTADWYKSFYAGNKSMYDVCAEQIWAYTTRAKVQKLAWSVK
jgi:CDP-glucose 4,6-dehydratase